MSLHSVDTLALELPPTCQLRMSWGQRKSRAVAGKPLAQSEDTHRNIPTGSGTKPLQHQPDLCNGVMHWREFMGGIAVLTAVAGDMRPLRHLSIEAVPATF